jgi:hypothetical protein
MEIGELFHDNAAQIIGESGNEEKGKLVVEEFTVYPDSQECSFFYYNDDQYFSSSFLCADKVVQLTDQWSFTALAFIDRLCRYMLTRGCSVHPGDSMPMDKLYTMRYVRGNKAFQLSSSDDSLVAKFTEQLEGIDLMLNGGLFYKNGVNTHGYTNPDANLELWMEAVCKKTDLLVGCRIGRTRRKIDSPQLASQVCPLALQPSYLLEPADAGLANALNCHIQNYLSFSAASHHTVGDVDSYERNLSLGYKTEIGISVGKSGAFSCVIDVERKRQELFSPCYMEFSLENEHFIFLHAEQSSIMKREEWLRALFLSITRAWTHPAQLVAYGVQSKKKNNNSVTIRRRYIEVEKEHVTCKICEDRPINWAYTSCGHCMCSECAAQQQKQCPFCKCKVQGNLKLFI